jgi:branched-subunit amino acid transport protein AzlD
LVIIAITFIILAGLHWLAKRVTLSVIEQTRARMMMRSSRGTKTHW